MPQSLIPTDPASLKRNNFDALRLAMAMLVVWSHSYALFLGSERNEPISRILGGAYNSGNIGVMVFFVISGFLVTRSFHNAATVPQFMMRRVRRIYPGYLVATSICAFIVIPAYSYLSDLSFTEVAKTIGANLFLRNYLPASNTFSANPFPQAVNGSLWSIPFEFWCYIGVMLVGMAAILTRRWLLVLAILTLLFLRVGQDISGHEIAIGRVGVIFGDFYTWSVILPNFLFGMLAYEFGTYIPRRRSILLALLCAAILLSRLDANLGHLAMPPILAYMVFYFSFSHSVRLYDAAKFGDFSYGVYLYAFPIQQMLAAHSLGNVSSFPRLIIASVVLSLVAGVISWHAVERWFLTDRHKAASPRAAARISGQASLQSPDSS